MKRKATRGKSKKTTNKRNLIWLALGAIGMVLLGLSWLAYHRYREQKQYPETVSFQFNNEYGIEMPKGYTIHGIDVSKFQGTIHWQKLSRKTAKSTPIYFAFIKATEGLGNVDTHFRRNWKNAKNAGLIRGAYHFFLATKSGKAQAENFKAVVKLESGDLPPVLDIEQLYGVEVNKMKKEIQQWLNAIEDYYGVKPIIYTSAFFYTNFLGDEFDDYPIWIAHYQLEQPPNIGRSWHFWQYSEKGKVPGIKGKVDFNVFNGDEHDLNALLFR